MATLAGAVSRICDDLTRPESEIGANVQKEILAAVEFYAPERFAFNERVLSFTISATDTYELSTILTNAGLPDIVEVIEPDKLRLYVSSRFYTLERRPHHELLEFKDSPTITGSPDYWSVFNQSTILDTTPNQTQTGYLYAHVRLSPLDQVSASNTNAWLVEGLSLIEARATRMVLQKKLDDFEKARVYEQIEVEALASLRNRGGKMLGSGSLTGRW